METLVSYSVTATSHIGPVKYSIALDISGADVPKFLAKGVLYEGQRIGASKAVKEMGGGKRADLPFSEENAQIVKDALLDVFGDDAVVMTSEYIRGLTAAPKKFAQARKILAKNVGQAQKVADRVGFEGEIYEDDDFTVEFLAAIENWNPFADESSE